MNCRLILTAALIAAATLATAQQKAPPVSPAATATATIGGKTITIKYNSPGVKGREGKLFGKDGRIGKDPHYPVWRGGANPATTLITEGDLTIGDLKVPAGTYTLFFDISDPDNWVMIVSKDVGEWGLAYDSTKDLGRTPMKMTKPSAMVENLKYTIDALGGTTGKITLEWEDHSASVLIAVH